MLLHSCVVNLKIKLATDLTQYSVGFHNRQSKAAVFQYDVFPA